jgi:O-antigen ligase
VSFHRSDRDAGAVNAPGQNTMTADPAPSNRISTAILFATVSAAPFPFGSTAPSAIAFWCILLGLGVIAASPRGLRQEHIPLLGLAIIVILAYAFVLHEQLAARPWIASPHPLWHEAAEVLGIPIAPSVSIVRNQPFFALGAPLANMLAVICSFIVCTDRNRAHQLLMVIAWSGLAYAIYGILAFLLEPTKILWWEKEAYLGVLTSTFINRNTAAIYFGSCSIVWLLLLSNRIRQKFPDNPIEWKKVFRSLLSEPPRGTISSFLLFFICLAAMFMTGSRAGVVLSLMMLIIAIAMFFYRNLPRRSGALIVVVVGGAIALVLLQIMGAGVSGRFDLQGLADEGRLETYRSTIRMIGDHPWFGTGLGTFAFSFPAYRSVHAGLWGVWDLAHSTPLEIAADLGLPLAGLVIAAWIIILAVLIRGVHNRRRDVIIPVAAFSVAALGLLHSLIDFSLQIPGYSIVIFALVGAGLSQSFPSSHANNGSKHSSLDHSGSPFG